MDKSDQYANPLTERYASVEMLYNFSPKKKFKTWRELWVILAECQKELGLDIITQEHISELKQHKNNLNLDIAREYEKKLKHDVMAHIHAYADQVPNARKIIHLGATSAYVGDNTDLIQIKGGLLLLQSKMIAVIKKIASFALKYKSLPTLGFTHFQAAQLTTVGKRASLWLRSLCQDFTDLEVTLENLEFLGVKGTTGTQASFKELFAGDYQKVKELDRMVTQRAGFKKSQSVSGQTYDRKIDSKILDLLSRITQSAHKFTNDIRLLQHLKEIEEPFEENQVGSSAMAYKQNPIRSERIASLSKFVMSLSTNGGMVASTQWFERTLDDSANRRLSIPQAFLGVDAILLLWIHIMDGLVVYPKVIEQNIKKELPFIATENILMAAVKKGQDRQVVHEIIRELSVKEAKKIKLEGKPNTLLQQIFEDGRLGLSLQELEDILDPMDYIGFAPEQVEDFIENEVQLLLEKYKDKQSYTSAAPRV